MTSRHQVAAAARAWVGTPYRHQGRLRGVACDCLGLVAGVGAELGLIAYTPPGYTPNPDGVTLRAECDRHLVRRADGEPAAGSVGLFWYVRRAFPQHLAIFTRLGDGRIGMVHANKANERVVEHGLSAFWGTRLVAVYDFPGVGG